MTLETPLQMLIHDIAFFVLGFALCALVWQVTNLIRDTRWNGRERRKAGNK
jgi:hypothetical protein